MKKILLITVAMISITCFSQVSIPPGKSVIVTAEQCPPTQVIIRDTIWQCPPVPPQPIDTSQFYGTLTFSVSFDKSTDVNTNQGPLNRLSSEQYVSAPTSFRTEAGQLTNVSSGYRGEMQYNDASQNPAEGVYQYDVFYQDWKAFDGGGHSVQWHPNSSTGSAVLSLQNYGGYFNVVRSISGTNYHQSGALKPVIPNKWYRMRWEIKWSTGTDGYIRLYIDNELYYTFKGKTTASGTYFKLGQNRWPFGSAKLQGNTVVFYDNLKIYKR